MSRVVGGLALRSLMLAREMLKKMKSNSPVEWYYGKRAAAPPGVRTAIWK